MFAYVVGLEGGPNLQDTVKQYKQAVSPIGGPVLTSNLTL